MTARTWAHTGTAVVVTGLLLATTSCAAPTAQSQPTEAPSSLAATASAAPSTPQTKAPILKPDDLPIKGPANDGRGEYLQTTIADGDPAMTIDPGIIDPAVKSRFADDEIASASQFILKFMAEEGIDSTLNGNPLDAGNVNDWWEKNKGKIAPSDQEELHTDLQGQDPNKNLTWRALHRQGKYDLAYGADRTRVLTRTITPKSMKTGESKGKTLLGLQADVSFTMAVVSHGRETVEATNAQMAYTVTKGEVPGTWLITGYDNYFTTTPAG